jgi:hypothetical protein
LLKRQFYGVLTLPTILFEENGQEMHFRESYDGLFKGTVRRNSRRLFQSMNLKCRVSTYLIVVKTIVKLLLFETFIMVAPLFHICAVQSGFLSYWFERESIPIAHTADFRSPGVRQKWGQIPLTSSKC